MNSKAKFAIVIVVLAALGSGTYAVFSGSQTSNTGTTSLSSSSTQHKIAVTIAFTGTGFTPATTTIRAGDTVQIINKSKQPLDFDSDPHPAHTDEPELNAGPVAPGKSTAITVTEKGRWGFHDHLNPSIHGTLIVK